MKYLQKKLSGAEYETLNRWISESDNNRLHFKKLTDEEFVCSELNKLYSYNKEKGWRTIERSFTFSNHSQVYNRCTNTKRERIRWRKMTAAAVLFLVLCGSYLFLRLNYHWDDHKRNIVKTNKPYKTNEQPGGNKAVLTLADGSTIALDDSPNGALALQGNTKVLKLNGKLAYQKLNLSSRKILYNTISTPRGGQFQIILPDGTAVWLNAASYMRFPTAFTGKERRVEISGEAYFEVAANKAMPFIVSVNGSAIKVFGTRFNVMAYTDESVLKTTLIEGSVEFYNSSISTRLKPGQQAELNSHGQIRVLNHPDVEEVMAWKNGYFYFENADIETVMRQIGRWYNIDVVYQHKKPADLLHADIPRNTTLPEVLKALEIAGGVKFKLDAQKIIVN